MSCKQVLNIYEASVGDTIGWAISLGVRLFTLNIDNFLEMIGWLERELLMKGFRRLM